MPTNIHSSVWSEQCPCNPIISFQVSLPDSVIETSRPVKCKDFAEHYRIMSADSDFRFSEEFEELKHVGRDQPCAAADLPVNRPKNRYNTLDIFVENIFHFNT